MPLPANMAHLLRRSGFGGTPQQVAALAAQPLATTVDQLLDTSGAPADTEPSFLSDDIGDWEKEYRLQHWWLDRMRTTSVPLQEKLALFWHGHFATENEKVGDAVLMYRQNALFRAQALGNFRSLVQQMSVQPAMLIYLDNDPNTADSPNENFGRELLELFTLGVNKYTQDDVVACARAWTGHNTLNSDRRQYQFYPGRHDYGSKTFLGVTRVWDGPDIVDYILGENSSKKRTAARFVAKKMWTFFAYANPETDLLDAITSEFYDNDLDIGALVRAIFLRSEFYSTRAKQGHVRSPVEWVVAVLRALGMSASETNPQWWMEDMGQQLFEPPNVAGWKTNAYWVATTNVWSRADWARSVTWRAWNAGVLSETRTMSVAAAVQRAFEVFGIDSPSSVTRARLETWLTRQRADSEAWRDWGFINLVTLVLLSPDFNVA